jgi:hypothetical protein
VVLVTLYRPCARIASAMTCLGMRGGCSQVWASAAAGQAAANMKRHDRIVA